MKHAYDLITIRIYGQNVQWERWRWVLMLDDMRPESINYGRIKRHLDDA